MVSGPPTTTDRKIGKRWGPDLRLQRPDRRRPAIRARGKQEIEQRKKDKAAKRAR
jgi:hypothetical protein